MMLLCFTVRDKIAEAFLPPFFARTKGEAIRQFQEAANAPDHQFAKYAADYTLFECGVFDDSAGRFTASEPVRVIGALEVRVPTEAPPIAPRAN